MACAIQSRKDSADYRNLFLKKQYKVAEDFLKESSLHEDKNRLLYLMEMASLKYYQERYKEAAKIFTEANQLVDQLYTKSIREALASSLINDNSNTFYGSLFERSLLYQYQALSFYKLAQRGWFYEVKKKDGKDTESKVKLTDDQIRLNFNRVRSTLIAWDSFFQEMNRMKGIKTFLKHDLLAKQMAANLHEALGSRRDREIALQLYKDAYGILVELGPTKKVFNRSYEKYNKQLKDYYDKKIGRGKIIAKDFTPQYHKTKDQLTYKILSLGKLMRSNTYSRLLKQYPPSTAVKKRLKGNYHNVTIVVENGIISPLQGKDFSYNLRSAIAGIENPGTRALVEGIGVPVLTYFALGPLGLGYVSRHGNVTVYGRHGAGEAITKEVGIEFELPYAKPSAEPNIYKLIITQGKKKVLERELSYMTSLSDIEFIHAQEMIANSFNKRATRVGVKYVVAIIAAYKTYKTMQDSGSGELFAKPAAVAQFLLSQKGIKESEKADVRHWTSLPDSLIQLNMSLKPGKYAVEFVEYSSKNKQLVRKLNFGEFEVKARKKSLFTYRTF